MELKDKVYSIYCTEYDGLEFDSIVFTQNDTNTCRLNFTLIEEVDRCVITIDKPDKEQVIDDVVKSVGVNYYYDLPVQAINVVGTYKATIQTYGTDYNRRTLGTFKYKISKDVNQDVIASATELPVLTNLITQVTNLDNEVNSNEAIRVQNEGNRVSNENTRIEKEITRYKEFDVIKKDYDTYKKVMIAESNVAALQSQINETNSSLDTKANDDEVRKKNILIGQTDITDDLRNAITGNAPVIQGIADNIVTTSKTTFIKPFVNLFNKETVLKDYYISNTNGNAIASTGWYASDYILVDPSTTYVETIKRRLAFYDLNKVFISGLDHNYTNDLITPANAKYIRLTIEANSLTKFMFVVGNTLPSEFYPYTLIIDKSIKKDVTDDINTISVDGSIEYKKLNCFTQSSNLFNKATALINSVVSNTNGNVSTATDWWASDYIEIEPNTSYIETQNMRLAFYDGFKTFISGLDNTHVNPFTTPSNAKYIRVSLYEKQNGGINLFMLLKGSVLPNDYVSFGHYLTGTNENPVIFTNIELKNSLYVEKRWKDKIWLCIGDSISNANMYQPVVKNKLGFSSYINNSKSGAKVSDLIPQNILVDTDISQADFITMFITTNDYGGNYPLGSISDEVGVLTTYGQLKEVTEKILNNMKNGAKVVYMTPLQRSNWSNNNTVGKNLLDYANAVKDVANLYSIPVVDLFYRSTFNKITIPRYCTDGLHPNDSIGYSILGDVMAQELNNL